MNSTYLDHMGRPICLKCGHAMHRDKDHDGGTGYLRRVAFVCDFADCHTDTVVEFRNHRTPSGRSARRG